MNKWMENEYVLRAISLLLAIMLWIFVNQPSWLFPTVKDTTRIENVSIEARYDSTHYAIIKMKNKVELQLTGNRYTLEHLPSTYRVYVDLRQLGAGAHKRVPVQVEGVPHGVEVKVIPSTIDVVLAKKT